MSFQRLDRFLSGVVLIMAVYGLVAGPVAAQAPTPSEERIDKSVVSLEAVESYNGLLSQRQGTIKVVVELQDTPAALVYAEAGGGANRNAVSQTKVQINKIQIAQTAFTQAVKAAGIQSTEIYRTQRVLNGIALEMDVKDVLAIIALPGVKAVYPLVGKELDHTASVALVGALQAWANVTPYQGDGIDVGIIDTGIDYTHKNFGGAGTITAYANNNPTIIEPSTFPTAKVVGGYDFSGNNYDANGRSGSTIPSPDADPLDCNGHGSHVAGTVAGLGILKAGISNPAAGDYSAYAALSLADFRNLFRIGPGMAPKANLYALKVFGCGGTSDLTDEAIEWAVDPNQDGDLSDHLDVINMSLGSSFGTENDTSSIASNNAALAGVIVVASAGNNGDVYYVTGSPGVAERAISVAGSQDGARVADGFGVTQTPDIGLLAGGVYGSLNSTSYNWLSPNSAVTGRLKYLGSGNSSGCQPFPAGAFSGTIALLDWTSLPNGSSQCISTVRTTNASNAGAIGVIFAFDKPTINTTISGSLTIPATLTPMANGDLLKAALASPLNPITPLTVKLSAEYNGTDLDPYNANLNDLVYVSGSRGPRRGDSDLKPDLTAPGVTIFSTSARSGDQGVNLSGTSMASPHVAGAMILLRQKYPDWSVEELKALVINSATHDVYVDESKTVMNHQDRIGAGRLDLSNAINSDLIAYSVDDPGAVNLSYGFQEVVDALSGIDQTIDKHVKMVNKSALPVSVTVDLNLRYPFNAGVNYTLYDGANPVANPVIIPASGSKTITIRQDIDAALLTHTRDEGIATSVTIQGVSYPREYLSESGGYIVITPTVISKPALRVSVYAAHRPAGNRVSTGPFNLGTNDEGTIPLPMTGTSVSNPDDKPLIYVMELLHENPNDTWSVGINNNADLMAVGAASDYSAFPSPSGLTNVSVFIGMATYGKWSTPLEVEFQVYIDVDENGVPDWVGINTGSSLFVGSIGDVFLSTICPYPLPAAADLAVQCDFKYTLNGDSSTLFGKVNSNPFNSNLMTLALSAERLGLSLTNTDFNFYVDTYSRDFTGLVDTTPWMHYDIGRQAFDTVDHITTQLPLWVDNSNLSLSYDMTDLYNQGGSQGLLLLHHHNAANKVEVVRFNPNYAAVVWDKYTELNVISGRKVSIPVRIVNESNTNCTFDLATAQTLTEWPVTLPLSQVFVPSHGSYVINATVTVPAASVPGSSKDILFTATCPQPSPAPPIVASNTLKVHAAYAYWFSLIGR